MIKDIKRLDLRLNLVAGLAVATAMGLASAGAAAQSGFTSINVTGAGTGAQQGTAVSAVDAAGDIAGIYVDTNNALHCFVLPAGGSIANCDVSGAGTSVGEGTFPTTINSSGVVAGSYVDASQVSHGFVRAVNGTITKFDAPLASQSGHRGTTVVSINDSGVIIGTYTTGTYSTNSAYFGFMRSADGLTFTGINDPSAGTIEDANGKKPGTTPVALNASGMIAGYYIDSSSVQHGFVRSASGTYTAIDPTGVGTCVNQNNGTNFGGTSASGIDAAGDVVGTYLDTSCAQHGFIRNASGTITSFNLPGAASSPCTTNGGSSQKICGTFLVLSDSLGDLTGSYIDTNGTIHGYLRPAATGIFTSFEDPNAYTSGSLNGTIGIAINSQTSGIEIAGMYLDANSVLHGYIYAPSLTATTTTLTPVPTPNPSVYGEPVTLTATVSSGSGTPANGENVTFMSGATSLGTAELTSGTASLTTTDLPAGADSITAAYDGDSSYAGSTSVAVSQTVSKASSSTTLKSSLNPSTFGQSVTLTANISGQFSGVATGTVTFSSGSASLGTASVSSNTATLATTALPVGTDSITAVYSGDGNFTGSTSNTISQVVNAATQPAATPTFLPVAGTYSSAQSVTISDTTPGATIYYTTNGTTPTTSSTVYSSSSPIAVSSSETIEAIATAGGYTTSAVVTAAYTIQGPGFTVSASPVSISVAQGSSAVVNVTVTDVLGFSGSVTLSESGLPSNVSVAIGPISPSGAQELIFSAGTSAAVTSGPVTVTITGTSGALTTSTTVALTITGQATTIFNNMANPCSPYTQTGPGCGYFPVFGPIGDSVVSLFDDTATQFTPAASGAATDARITVVQNQPVPDLGASGLLNVAIYSDANGAPGTQISQTATSLVAPYCCNAANLTAWFGQSVSLSAGVPYWLVVTPGASETYVGWVVGGLSPVPTDQSLSSGQQCNNWCSYAPSNVQFAIDGGTTPPPGFMLSASPATLNVSQGSSITSTITVADLGGFSGAVVLAASGLPSGVTASFAAGSVGGTQVLTLSASSSAAITSSPLTVTIVGTSGSLNAITAVTITVTVANVTATPTFLPVAGTYTAAQSVTISDATSGATIYYTTNGTTPTTSSTKYTGAITVSSTETIEAIATASGYSNSAVASATYTINIVSQAATPTFSPVAGTYTSAQSVTISDATTGATIYYTTNGTTPTASSTKYTGAITVSSTETLEAIATASGYSTSAVATAAYTINSSTGATLVGAPNTTGSYYGMFGTDFAAEFTLSTSANVTTINVVVLGNGIYDFSLQSSLTGSITTYAQAVITAPTSGLNTETITVNATLPAGRYFLVASKDATSTQTVPGWFVSDGTYLTNAGSVADGDWYSSSLAGPWTFESGLIGAITYVAPTFIVNGTAVAQSPAATPTFSPVAGTYTAAQSVTISDTAPGATIYYTTNGTTPTALSTVYSGPITVSASETLEAIATASGYSTSAVATAAYTINLPAQAATPTFSPIAGTYTFAQSVTISDTTPGATIYYTTNGTTPTTSSTVYSGAITISSSETLEAIATASGYITSGVATGAYSINTSGFQGFVLYSTVGTVGSSSVYPNSLITVNPATGSQQLVGQSGQAINVAWLTADPVHNVLYGTGLESSGSETTLYTINPNSGSVSGQVPLSQSVSAIAASPQGTLYGLSGTSLGTINAATGQFSPVGTVSLASGYTLRAMTFSPAGVLYGVEENSQGGAAFNQQLLTLNPASGATVSDIGDLGSYNVEDMTYAPDGNIYATNFSYTLLKINPQTASNTLIGLGSIGDLGGIAAVATSVAATPAFSPVAGTYTSAQFVTITDATAGATFYYTTNGTTPTTSSTAYNGPISVSSSETIGAIATASGYTNSAVASAAYVINIPVAATPTFTPIAGTYTSAQSVTISDTTAGATIYYTTNGTTPTTSSSVYSSAITVSSTETLEAIATASGFTTSAVATAAYTINLSTNPTPIITGASPAFTNAAGAAFTLTVNGSGFTTGSTVYWGTSALATTYVSSAQLTAQVPATDIATGGITVAITVTTPAPGGGTSSSFQFEVDSASGSTTGPTFTSTIATVKAGSSATYPVTLPSDVTSASVTCLNLPAGATCSYSSSTKVLTIATSATTPTGTYQITVVFNETVTAAAAFILLPILLLPLLILRKQLARRGIWISACVVLILLASVAFNVGCGGGGSGGGGGGGGGTQTQQVTSSGAVSLTVQ